MLVSLLSDGHAQSAKKARNKPAGEIWSAAEYSGSRTPDNLRIALASKGFTWLSGSPADNEKLSVGKNAQFFGFVALRYQSGRAANRGVLGRAFYSIASDTQRKILHEAVLEEADDLTAWWNTRERILRALEHHLYTGEVIDAKATAALGAQWSKHNATIAICEARAFAKLEDTLTAKQRERLKVWRKDPEQAQSFGKDARVEARGLDRSQRKQLEDLYAKAFSWITGTARDTEIIPLGQPAQFFGFVSIRHKSGHAASRGKIAKSFRQLLSPEQSGFLNDAVRAEEPVVRRFLELRHEFLGSLTSLRHDPKSFKLDKTMELAAEMGKFEIQAAIIEAQAYRMIRQSMTDQQLVSMMKLRGNYVVNSAQMELLTHEQRGERLAMLCVGCHAAPGRHEPRMVGPSLDGIFDRKIASAKGFGYSTALKEAGGGKLWSPALMDRFLADPKTFAPGTKMEFQGLLNEGDRKALIDYLQRLR